jgi:hypothetical protein
MNKNIFNMLVSMTISKDQYHDYDKEARFHIVSSIFYILENKLNLDNLIRSDALDVIFFVYRDIKDLAIFELVIKNPSTILNYSDEYLNNYGVDLLSKNSGIYKLELNKKIIFCISFYDLVESGTEYILLLLGLRNSDNKEEVEGYVTVSSLKTLFIFKNIDWNNLQKLLSQSGIFVSGGSITNRHLLSTVEFQLSNWINLLGYNDLSFIYESNYFRKLYKGEGDLCYSKTDFADKLLLIKLLDIAYSDVIIKAQKEKEELVKRILRYEEEKNNLSKIVALNDPSRAIATKKNKKSAVSRVSDRITNISKIIPEVNLKIKEIEFKLIEFQNKKKSIPNENYLTLREIYETNYKEKLNRSNYGEFKSKVNDIRLNKKNSKFNKNIYSHSYNSRRRFSTTSYESDVKSLGILLKNKILINNKIHSSDRKLLNSGILFSNIFINKYKYRVFSRRNLNTMLNYENKNYNSIISKDLLEIIYSDSNKEKNQKNMEYFLINQQHTKILNRISSNIDYNILNPNIIRILLECKKDFKYLYENFIKVKNKLNSKNSQYREILSIVGFDYISYILYGRLLSLLSNRVRFVVKIDNPNINFTNVAYDVGKDLINKYNYMKYLSVKEVYKSFSIFKLENQNINYSLEDPTFVVELGLILIGWLIELKLIARKIEILALKEKKGYIVPGSKLNKYIKEFKNNPILNLPIKLPMIIPPKKYLNSEGKVQLGGYLLNDEYYTESLFIDKPGLVEKSFTEEENIIYSMVDHINSVSFVINSEVLDFILKHYKKYSLLIDLDNRHPLEEKPKLTKQEKKELESYNSKKRLEMEIINLALIFRTVNSFYLPVRLDYRGRLYCVVEYLNYQGSDLAKALLKFAVGEKVYLNNERAINYLKIFGASCFGLGKESFKNRINWINNNESDIINFINGDIIHKAENKLLFISFCFEYLKYVDALKNNKEYFISCLPIQLDATCNGFQHLSLLLEDTTLAQEVNLGAATWEDSPNDFYSFLSMNCKKYFEDELLNNTDLNKETKESYIRLSNINYSNHRKMVKKTIMTIPYNATKYANKIDLKEDFEYLNGKYYYKNDKKIIFKEIDFKLLCDTLYICLYRDFPKIKALLNYFKEIANISNKLNISIPWYLPTGLVVKQKYYANSKVKLKPFIYSKDLLTLNIYIKDKFNTRKQSRALMPNIVHSLDAASLALLVNNYFKENNNNFFSVHDCFAVTCNNIDLISQLLKLSYYHIYSSKNFIEKFDEGFKNYIEVIYGKQSFSEDKKLITILKEDGSILNLIYPDLKKVYQPANMEFLNSSYLIT